MVKRTKVIVNKALGNQLVSGSLVLFLGNSLASFGNYLYHLLMGRMLGPVDYGHLASLISFIYILGVPMMALNIVVVKFVSSLRGEKKEASLKYLYFWLVKRVGFISFPVFFCLLLFLPLLKNFLHWESGWPFFWIVTSSLLMIYFSINSSFMQGFLKFKLMTLTGILQVTLKLSLAVLLVGFGRGVLGAVLSFPASATLAIIFSTFIVFSLLKGSRQKVKFFSGKEILRYAVPVFVTSLSFTSLYTADILLVRHFLPAQLVGYYAALATLGKIIFFAANPIIQVMFPMVSEKHASGQNYANFLGLSLFLVGGIIFGVAGVYFLLPELMVKLLYGASYLNAAPYLGRFSLFLGLYMLSYLLANFYLSIKRTKVVVLPFLAALIQIVLIWFWHTSISQVIWCSTLSTGLLLVFLIFFDFSVTQDVFRQLWRYRLQLKLQEK